MLPLLTNPRDLIVVVAVAVAVVIVAATAAKLPPPLKRAIKSALFFVYGT